MRVFFLDLASGFGLLACVDAENVLSSKPVDRRLPDGELLPLAEAALKDAGWTWKDVEAIASVSGPGGFMGLKMGAAFANALSSSLKVPSSSIHLSDLCHARTSEKDFLWIHSTKKLEVFVRGFGEFAEQFPEAIHIGFDELLKELPAAPLVGELIDDHRSALLKVGCTEVQLKPVTDVLPEVLSQLSYKKQTVLPWYGREG